MKNILNQFNNKKNKNKAFTIIELIVVIIIIGILSAVVYVGYGSVRAQASDASVLSDLDTLDGLMTNYALENNVAGKAVYLEGGVTDTDLGFTPSEGNVIDVVIDGADYCIRGYNPKGTKNNITSFFEKESSEGACDRIPTSYLARKIPTITIGTQVWMQYNINIGTKIDKLQYSSQSDNDIIEKYCVGNLDGNCDEDGGLYEWSEAMQYSAEEGAQGICPDSFHIPTDLEFKTLEMFLGMSQADADSTLWRWGYDDEGIKLGANGSSGFEATPVGYMSYGTTGIGNTTVAYFNTSSSSSDTNAWKRGIMSGYPKVERSANPKTHAMSVRCILD